MLIPDGAEADKPQEEVIDEFYLVTCSRRPTPAETARCRDHLAKVPSQKEGYEDLLWALINCAEFLFNQFNLNPRRRKTLVQSPLSMGVDYDYIDVFGLKMKEGRNFSRDQVLLELKKLTVQIHDVGHMNVGPHLGPSKNRDLSILNRVMGQDVDGQVKPHSG